MPRRDGTGPIGQGPMTGKGAGYCAHTSTARNGSGFGFGMGLAGRGYHRHGLGRCYFSGITQKQLLLQQKAELEKQISTINQQLDTL